MFLSYIRGAFFCSAIIFKIVDNLKKLSYPKNSRSLNAYLLRNRFAYHCQSLKKSSHL